MTATLSNIKTDSNWGIEAPKINQNFASVNVELEKLKSGTVLNKGYYKSLELLQDAYPPEKSKVGMIAYVGINSPYIIYEYKAGSGWTSTGKTYIPEVNLGDYYTKEEADATQIENNERFGVIENNVLNCYTKEEASKANDLYNEKFQSLEDKINESGSDNITINGDVTNNADDEDIESVINTETQLGVLKFKDREYMPSNFSGKGYVILRKNMINGKNVLTQEMIPKLKQNIVYEIRYDFDLNREEIFIPEGCTLKFNGGSLSNGTMDFNHCTIEAKGKIFDITLNIKPKSIDEVYSDWIGMVANSEKDYSEILTHFVQFSITLKIRRGTYILNKINNMLLARGTEIIGDCDNREYVTFKIAPTEKYDYLFGINYYCSFKNITIQYDHNDKELPYGIILLVDTSFRDDTDSSQGSYYNYQIDNVNINSYEQNSLLRDKGYIGLAIKCNKYNSFDPEKVNVVKALSWFPKVANFRVNFAHIGILIQSHQDSPSDGYWCNSLLFENILINAFYGFYFDRKNPSSAGWDVINNYMFQAKDSYDSFGLYGNFQYERVNNYLSWDNVYLGKGYGSLYITDTSLQIPPYTQTGLKDSINGFIQETDEGGIPKRFVVNFNNKNKYRYPTEDYNPSTGYGYGIVDYSKPKEITWTPVGHLDVSFTKDILDMKANQSFEMRKEIYSGNKEKPYFISYVENYSNRGITKKFSKGINMTSGYNYLMDFTGEPKFNYYGDSWFFENYGFKSFIVAKNLSDYNAIYKVVIQIQGDNTNIDDFYVFYKNLSVIGGVLLDCKVYSKSESVKKGVELTIRPTYSVNMYVYICITCKIRAIDITLDEMTQPHPDTYKVTTSATKIRKIKGTTAERPTENIKKGDTYYNTDTDRTEIYRGSYWQTEDGISVNARKSGTFAQKPTSSDNIPLGFSYYCTDKRSEESSEDGLIIYYKGSNKWIDALGRIIS